ncbi:PAS domain-containing protein [Pseudorhodoferax sp. Leaf274]|uniref:PAS domain-containing protein n=1 Tax=Pseudorhodoferax sp. Leaf274 TaxID=1736318 RepID=UPI000703A7DA|nr:PAS domain-containing protein [Pseudorhodoferax sp. Leaf274]KQP49683.1 phosphonate transporter [Pseudorhodoferax sp. Leaf274]
MSLPAGHPGALQDRAMDAPDLAAVLERTDVDQLGFGVIGFDADCIVRVYNKHESAAAGLLPERVLGHHLFESVAPCMNNFLVAQRFEDAAAASSALDDTIAYVLTLRMRPTPVRLRLLADPALRWRYVLVQRG